MNKQFWIRDIYLKESCLVERLNITRKLAGDYVRNYKWIKPERVKGYIFKATDNNILVARKNHRQYIRSLRNA